MAGDAISSDHTASGSQQQHPRKVEEKRHRSIFEVPSDFFDSCRVLRFPSSFSIAEPLHSLSLSTVHTREPVGDDEEVEANSQQPQETTKTKTLRRWSCNTCKSEFESLEDQRFHFKSDIHRFNIKLSLAGKDTMKEEDFEKFCSDSFCKDYDVSSISGSEDEEDRDSVVCNRGFGGATKKKIYVQLQSGERVSVWKCILLDESENISLEDDNAFASNSDVYMSCLTERESIEKLKYLIHVPRDNISLRVILLARGGHFAGCVFDGNSIVAHKTFHRYVVRAKAGKKQSSKDASGRSAHSAGASLRRYNELALKKDIQELLAAWKSYFDASSCIFIYAPSNNRQLFFDGEKPYFSCHHHAIRNVPLTVRRPTFKEARRIYYLLTQISYEVDEKIEPNIDGNSQSSARILTDVCPGASKDTHVNSLGHEETTEASVGIKDFDKLSKSSGSEREFTVKTTPLHDAARGGDAQKVLELLEQGMDPCIKDERGRTPYMLTSEKEVRNTFRRFLASNLDKWDWHAANVPSALTKEMEESQAAKQAEKDAKRKARSKELKKLRKARDKKPQAESTQSQTTSMVSGSRGSTAIPSLKVLSPCSSGVQMSKEEALKRAQEEEREKRAAAAERRIAALKAQGSSLITTSNSSQPKNVVATDLSCSCCNASLAGVVPFHRYNFKYCSTSCMHVHREILEDG